MTYRLADLLLALPIFLLSLSFHEYMHAWAADKMGDPTARAMGRLTINPRAHIDPFGFIIFVFAVLFSNIFIGWAKPVPINPGNFRNPRRDFAFVAISGPGANFMQALGWYLLWRFLTMTFPFPSAALETLLAFTRAGVIINLALLCFNLLPIPPLDGSRVLAWLLPPRHAILVDRMEPFGFFILLLLLWTGILGMIYHPLLGVAVRLFPGFVPGF